jgi:2-phosphoglycerate kinase
VQTSIVHKVMAGLSGSILTPQQRSDSLTVLSLEHKTDQDIVDDYVSTCRQVRKGCNFDIQKCFVDGKPLIIEGSHIEPNLFVKQVPKGEGETLLQIVTPDPATEEEAKLENDPMRKMRKAMNAIN